MGLVQALHGACSTAFSPRVCAGVVQQVDEKLHGLQGQVIARAAQVALQAAQAARMSSTGSFGSYPESSGSTDICLPGLDRVLCV